MHLRLVAVGDRQPAWVETAFSDYAGRLPRAFRFNCKPLATSKRRKHGDAAGARSEESKRILDNIGASERLVALDEGGKQLSSKQLAAAMLEWQRDGRDICFVIGGPDGLDDTVFARADFRWSLSKLTLPHGLARVLFAEQLYRASTLNEGHPYHRA